MSREVREIKQRLAWISHYQQTDDVGLTCRTGGISRLTLRKWLRRYQELGVHGLRSRSSRPRNSPTTKVADQQAEWILRLRSERKLDVRRIQNELKQSHGLTLSHKVLTRHSVQPLRRTRRVRKPKRYQKAIPGERVQMDTCKIAPGLYQYTAVDDCTRY